MEINVILSLYEIPIYSNNQLSVYNNKSNIYLIYTKVTSLKRRDSE